MVEPAPPPASTNASQMAWQDEARTRNWKKAHALAQLQSADPLVLDALQLVVELTSEIRARRYLRAQTSAQAFIENQQLLSEQSEGLSQSFASWIQPSLLLTALDALITGQEQMHVVELKAQLETALAHPLTKSEALNMLGILHARREETEAALRCFQSALTHDPYHYRARMNIGNLALEAGNFEEAEAAFRQVLAEAPEYDGAHHNLGVVLRRQGKLYESVRAIRKGQRLRVKQVREETKLEAKQQFAHNPNLRKVQMVGWAMLGLLVLWVLLDVGR